MLDFLIGNNFLSSVVAFALVLIPAVIIHELGHLLTAKAVGITILEFGIGFPPRMFKLFRWGETEFTLNWLMIGGFVLPLGEDFIRPVSDEQVQRDKEKLEARLYEDKVKNDPDDELDQRLKTISNPKSVSEAKPLGRIFFMAGGALANFLSAFVLFVVIGLIGTPTFAGARVEVAYVDPDSTAAQAGLQANDVIEQLNGEVFETSADFFARLNALDGETATLTIRRGEQGELVQVEFNPQTEDVMLQEGYVRVMAVVSGSPAESAGLEPGDLIAAFNGETIMAVDRLIELTDEHAGEEVILTVQRADGVADLTLIPRVNPPEGQGPIGISILPAITDSVSGVIYQEGIPQEELVPLPLPQALQYGVLNITDTMYRIVQLPVELIRGTITVEEARPVSIVGISDIGGRFLQQSIEDNQPVLFLRYIAIISIALGVTNLLPIPALDGGRILFVLIEIIRGRPVKPEFEGVVHLVGLALLLSVAVVFILNDIINPIVIP